MKKLLIALIVFTSFSCTQDKIDDFENEVTTETNTIEVDTFACGLIEDEATIKIAQEISKIEYSANTFFSRNAKRLVPIKAHIIQLETDEGGFSFFDEVDLDQSIFEMNQKYDEGGIEFFLCGEVDYIPNNEYFDFIRYEDEASLIINNQPNVINIYFANNVKAYGNTGSLCGYAYFPSGTLQSETVLMKNSCAKNGSTLSHEVGHTLGLPHTQGFGSTTNELVNGSNCEVSGDFICDTPADPNLLGKVGYSNGECTYLYSNSTYTDANGWFYDPDVENIMSYSLKSCRSRFSPQQFQRMNAVLDTSRSNLVCTDTVTETPITRPEDAGCYAVSVVDYTVGTKGQKVKDSRQNPINALGEPQETEGNHFNFVTLGYGGELILDFEGAIPNLEGNDFQVFETNHDNKTCAQWTELANISVSQDLETWSSKQLICTDDEEIDISNLSNFEWIRYVKLDTDDVPTNSNDGFDVDAIVNLHCNNKLFILSAMLKLWLTT